MPSTSTGIDGPADFTCLPLSSISARTLPLSAPTTKMSPTFSVPRLTSTVATGPRPLSSFASITMPSAGRSGLAFSSSSSACSWIFSISSSRPVFLSADTSTSCVSPPIASTWTSCSSSRSRTFWALASGLSILLIATIIGTPAALVWLIASIVCGISPSSAATTSTTMSVTLAPRARICGEGLVARRVEEGDLRLVLQRHLIGADMLGDAARLAAHHVGAAQRVEQAGLAVIDMAHDRDDRRARAQRFLGVLDRVERQIDVGIATRGRCCGRIRSPAVRRCPGRSSAFIVTGMPILNSALTRSAPFSAMRLASS